MSVCGGLQLEQNMSKRKRKKKLNQLPKPLQEVRKRSMKLPALAQRAGNPMLADNNKPNPAKTRKSKDGRDRKQAEVVDTYDATNTKEGRVKEQHQIDQQ